ncbi:MAG: Ig-like domain repeat protein, partial [Acidobacteriaceae bacterium]
MRKIKFFPAMCGLFAAFVFLMVSPVQAAVQNRIASAISNSQMIQLKGNVHPLAQARYDRGPVQADLAINGMTLTFKPSAAQQADLDALLESQRIPGSANYHKWLTPQQYADRFGLSVQDMQKVQSWLQTQGFTVNRIAPSRNEIAFSGTAAQVEATFHTSIHHYQVDNETRFANETNPSLPSAIASMVTGVGGLNNFFPKPKNIKMLQSAVANSVHGNFTSATTGKHFISPGDFATIYNVTPMYNAGYTGTGQTLAIVGQTAIYSNDIAAFRTAAGLPAINLTTTCASTTTSNCNTINQGDLPESDLDIEWSGAVAKDANIVFVTDPQNGAFNALAYAITNKIGGVISVSYGACELGNSSYATSLQTYIQQANTQGQTVVAASGDDGAADCDYSTTSTPVTSATHGLQVDMPSDVPGVTGLGGAEFNEGTATGGTTYWQPATSSTADLVNSAISYMPEKAWNDTTVSITNGGGFAAGGGGKSLFFAKPSWQVGLTPSDGARDTPDLSLNASPVHDGYLVCTQEFTSGTTPTATGTSCVNGFRYTDNSLTVYGGTSVAAPTFAGILTLINQQEGSTSGNLNPLLYTLAADPTIYSQAFHDITVGDNKVPCTAGTTDCPVGTTSIGYTAGTGYDQATGLGSVNAFNLAAAIHASLTATGTTTAIALSPGSPSVGQTVTLTATVTPKSGSTTPTGSVTFKVGSTSIGTVNLSAGVATTTYAFTFGGTQTVTAVYSGDSTYAASTTSSTVTVAATGTTATTTTLMVNPSSVAVGSSVTFTATVSPTPPNGEQVIFKLGSTTLGTASVTSGVASLTLPAITSNGLIVGTNSITAVYGGDGTYGASTSTAVTLTVTNPSFTISATNMTISSAAANNSGTSTITVTSAGGYAGTVNVTSTSSTLSGCYTLSTYNSTTGLSPIQVTAGGTGTATITIYTAGSTACSTSTTGGA